MGRLSLFFKRHGMDIMTAGGIAGLITTGVLAAVQTPKALDAAKRMEKEKGEALTWMEKARAMFPYYIPPAISGAASAGCILGMRQFSKVQQASLASAYGLLNASYLQYKQQIEDKYGKEEVIEGPSKEKSIKKAHIHTEIFWDPIIGDFFEATMEEVKHAHQRLQEMLHKYGHVSLNEYYKYLHRETIPAGYTLGWNLERTLDANGDTRLRFDCYTIDHEFIYEDGEIPEEEGIDKNIADKLHTNMCYIDSIEPLPSCQYWEDY